MMVGALQTDEKNSLLDRGPASSEEAGFSEVVAPRSGLARLLSVQPSDLRALPYSASAGFTIIGSYYFIQPLSDALALKVGLKHTPLITMANMALIVVANPLYAALSRAIPPSRMLPTVYRILASMLIAFGAAFYGWPESRPLSFSFAVFTGTFSLFLTSTFWARMASLHSKAEAKRVYGVIAAGGQLGQLAASVAAPLMFGYLQQKIVLASALLMELGAHLTAARGAIDRPLAAADKEAAAPPVASGAEADSGGGAQAGSRSSFWRRAYDSALGDLGLLMSTPLLRAITVHTLLYTFLVSGVWCDTAGFCTLVARRTVVRVLVAGTSAPTPWWPPSPPTPHASTFSRRSTLWSDRRHWPPRSSSSRTCCASLASTARCSSSPSS